MGRGATPEEISRGIRQALNAIKKELAKNGIQSFIAKQVLTGHFGNGHNFSVGIRIIHASNGETAGLFMVNIDGKVYDNWPRPAELIVKTAQEFDDTSI